MKTQEEILKLANLMVYEIGEDGGCGRIFLNGPKSHFCSAIWSFGGGWDHVSIAYSRRCPTWEEMCRAKDMFFREDETVVQFHPKKSNYVNRHPFCLHLWRKQGTETELPPQYLV